MLIVRKEAEEDIKSAYEWYEEQRINLGHAFVAEIDSKLQEIEEHPDLYMEVLGNVRRALCKRFPYSIYFIQNKIDIVVIAVLHQRRNPATWQGRKQAEQAIPPGAEKRAGELSVSRVKHPQEIMKCLSIYGRF